MDLTKISSLLSEAAIIDNQWPDLLNTISDQTSSVGALMLPCGPNDTFTKFPFTPSLAESCSAYVEEKWMTRDLRRRGLALLKSKGIYGEPDHATEEEIKRHPYYQDFLGRFKLRWSAQVKVMAGDDLWCLSLQRGVDQQPFSSLELRQLQHAGPIFSGAAALARTLGLARAEGALEGLEFSKFPAFLLDRRGRIFSFNALGETLIGPCLRIDRGRLQSHSQTATKALDAAIWRVLSEYRKPLAISVPLPRNEHRPLLACVTSLSGISRDAFAPCQALVVIFDPEHSSSPNIEAVRLCYGLTVAESRLVQRIAIGENIELASHYLGIKKDTARKTLKSIFEKMHIKRQAELVLLMSRFRA